MRNKIMVIILLLSTSLFSTYLCPAQNLIKENEAAKLNLQGVEFLNKKDYSSAIYYFEQALLIVPENKIVKANLATAYNNYAIELGKKNNIDGAKTNLYKAIEIDPGCKDYKTNLANIIFSSAYNYFQEGEYDRAKEELTEITKFMPDFVPALTLLGHINYQEQDFESAKKYLESAKKLDPSNKDIIALLNKLKKEEKLEKQFGQLDAYHFDLRYDKEILEDNIHDIKFYLQEAYREVGRDFNYYPNYTIPVIFYEQTEFKKLRNAPDWVAGVYDGKIRLPILKDNISESDLKRVIWHEYTHALVFDLTGGNCPTWFNEGLAKWEEAKILPVDTAQIAQAITQNQIISLKDLEPCFSLSTGPVKLSLAYLEAYTFIEFILDRWNFYTIKSILHHLKQGNTLDKAFSREFDKSLRRLDSEWKDFLKKKYL